MTRDEAIEKAARALLARWHERAALEAALALPLEPPEERALHRDCDLYAVDLGRMIKERDALLDEARRLLERGDIAPESVASRLWRAQYDALKKRESGATEAARPLTHAQETSAGSTGDASPSGNMSGAPGSLTDTPGATAQAAAATEEPSAAKPHGAGGGAPGLLVTMADDRSQQPPAHQDDDHK